MNQIRLLACCIGLQAIVPGCHRGKGQTAAEQSEPSAPDVGLVDASTPDASSAAFAGLQAHECGLANPRHIELIPMVRNRLVVSRTLRATKLSGTPKLVAQPSEFENYYLAESGFEPDSLPLQVVGLRGASVSFVSAPDCHARVSTLSAWAWASEQGTGWKPGNPAFNAARAFRDGDSFLVAVLDLVCPPEQSVAGATGQLPAHFHVWQVRDLSEQGQTDENIQLMRRGLVALESEPALTASNLAYARFRNVVRRPLPDRWWFLPQIFARWSLATDGDAALLIVELRGRDVIQNQEFSAAWLGIWCIGSGGRLESLGLDYLPHELTDTVTNRRNRLLVAGAPDELPLILYSHYSLQADTGRYRTYEYALPAPALLE